MRHSLIFVVTVLAAGVANGATVDLIQHPSGALGFTIATGGDTGGTSHNCWFCVFDGDPTTYWQVRAEREPWPGSMTTYAAANRSFHRPAAVDRLSVIAELEVDALSPLGVSRTGSIALQIFEPGGVYQTFFSESFDDLGGSSPARIEVNWTFNNLALPPLGGISIVAQTQTLTEGEEFVDQTFQFAQSRIFHVEAFGKFVPEPETGSCLWPGLLVMLGIRRRRKVAKQHCYRPCN